MKSLIENAVSFLEHGLGNWLLPESDSPVDGIVSGYSYPTNNDQRNLMESYDRRKAGIFYADIANYTRLTEQDEEGTHHRLVERMKIMEAYVAANNGRVAHFAGDAILAEFKDAESALHCAINVQLVAQKCNGHLHSDQQVLFRIGVNFGDVIADHGDIFGNAVNLAARLETLACSGGICVSESVRRRLKNHPSFKFVAMGKQYVKNIREPVEAFWIEIDAEQIDHVDHSCVTSALAAGS
jgi:adenylate cyclase